jgi:hypothetical protein
MATDEVKITIDGASLQPMLEEHFVEMLREVASRLGNGVLLDARSGWQPIETAPRDGTRVLIVRAQEMGGGSLGMRVGIGKWKSGKWQGDCTQAPTHWMPLPEPPGEGEG